MASQFINGTGCHVFLTGKAGTGKTTFLREIVQQTHKKVVVAAPTGIAAINAGGVTLHSLFHLPFGTFLPSAEGLAQHHISIQINTPHTLVKNLKMHETRRRMIREMELLIIDEVSMLRADLLDAIDTILRHIRRNRAVPFGGVQMLFIGDMLQLPPVVKHEEWQFLKMHYRGVYFFHARALDEQPPLRIGLDKIYRQSDQRFIALLNRLRDDSPSHEDIELLNRHVNPAFDSTQQEGCIFLTTHNNKADRINQQAIARISSPAYHYDAEVIGDFNESQYPLERRLTFREGAQVMFIKNDHTGERRYFNGKIGTVEELDHDHIVVRFSDGSPSTGVDRYTWENKKYSLSKDTNEIEERVAGTFSQFPLRLAWAITVHKSQGLTFGQAVIDVSAAFAPGQIYVALSRLTGLDGLILSAPLPQRCPGPDAELLAYTGQTMPGSELAHTLQHESLRFVSRQLQAAFDLRPLADTCKWFVKSFNKEEGRSAKQRYHEWAVELYNTVLPVQEVAGRFLRQLRGLPGFSSWDGNGSPRNDSRQTTMMADWASGLAPDTASGNAPGGGSDEAGEGAMGQPAGNSGLAPENELIMPVVHERVKAAADYFHPIMIDLSNRIFAHIMSIEGLSGVKGYLTELRELESSFFGCLQRMQKMEALLRAMMEKAEPTRERLKDAKLVRDRANMLAVSTMGKKGGSTPGKRQRGTKKKKPEEIHDLTAYLKARSGHAEDTKIRSAEVSLALFLEGHAIEEIATQRSLAISTVAGHLAECVEKGMIAVERFLEKEKLEQILQASEAVGSTRISDIMAVLGDEFSFADVRFALAARRGRD